MREHTQAYRLTHSPSFQSAKQALLRAIQEQAAPFAAIRGATSPELKKQYSEAIQAFAKDKGRDQYFEYLSAGAGSGPYVELVDGSVKLDLITGIGVNFFGHSHPELMAELIDGVPSDCMQGNLQPGYESQVLIRKLLSLVGDQSRLRHAWLFCSGTMSNETALKIIRQKKFPATKIFAFNDCFAGRSTAMQEITDNPKYREGQPTYGEVSYLPFYREEWGLERSVEETLKPMLAEVARQPGKYAGIMMELIQGEGGIHWAPREWYTRVLDAAKKAGLAVWFDEIQTFGRTERLFAYQHFGLDAYADVVTVGKMLQACATLYAEEFNPRPGLVAGTFTGSAAALKTGRRVLEILSEQGYYGPDGKIARLSRHFRSRIEALKNGPCRGMIGEIRALGGFIGFEVLGGGADPTKKFLLNLFQEGVVAFTAGHGPYLVRLLPPFGVMEEKQIDEACQIIEKTLKATHASLDAGKTGA